MNIHAIKDEVLAAGKEWASESNLSAEDRALVIDWSVGLGDALFRAATADDPEEKQVAQSDAQGFKDALSMKVAQYEVRAASNAEKAYAKVLTRLVSIAVAAI